MGTKAKAQRPKKRKIRTPNAEAEGPPRRMQKKGREFADAEPDWGSTSADDEGKAKERTEELAALETMLFGAPTSTKSPSEEGAPRHGASSPEKKKRKRRETANSSSTVPEAAETEATEAWEEMGRNTATGEATGAAKAAWVDPEDAKLRIDIDANPKLRKLKTRKGERFISGEEYQKRLQSLHNKLVGKRQGLDWIHQARQRKLQAAGEAEGLDGAPVGLTATGQEGPLMTGEQLVLAGGGRASSRRKGTVPLPAAKIKIRRLEDANKQDPSLCAVTCLDFHPKSNILLTAGRDKTLRLFLVDGNKNARLESLHLSGFPVVAARFNNHNEGRSLFVLSNATRSIGEYDLQEGKLAQVPGIGGRREERCFHHLAVSPGPDWGQSSPIVNTFAVASATSQSVLLCHASTKRLLNVLQMNAPVVGMAYHPHRPHSFLTADAEACVYEWEMRTGRCVSKMHDRSCLRLTSFAVSSPPQGAFSHNRPSSILALGSRTGYTDLFGLPEEGPVPSQPLKVLGNLTTAVSTVCFHPGNELLCAASKWKKDALKLIHLPSTSVFQNWPSGKTPMHYVTAAAFSRQHGLFAIGNDTGKVLLYQLRHYA